MPIKASVGKNGINDPDDVQIVETQLALHRAWLAPMPTLIPDGVCNQETIDSILKFQATAAALEKSRCDGVVSARGFTIKRLELGVIPFPKHKVFRDFCWARTGPGLGKADFDAAAITLGCESAAIQAVAEQEAGTQGPWDADYGRPTILFERHKFSSHTKKVWNATHPDIANEARGGYGKFSAQYPKLYRAATLDESAALKSASWGSFQILGENHAACGYGSVDAFVDAMLESEAKHLQAFVAFVASTGNLKSAIQKKDWAAFAAGYNGPKYKENRYDTLMAERYARLAPPPKPKPKP